MPSGTNVTACEGTFICKIGTYRTNFHNFPPHVESPEGTSKIRRERGKTGFLRREAFSTMIAINGKDPASPGSKQFGYELTEKGHALKALVRAIRDWGLKWERGTRVGLS